MLQHIMLQHYRRQNSNSNVQGKFCNLGRAKQTTGIGEVNSICNKSKVQGENTIDSF